MKSYECLLPVHLDFTCLFGAAQAIEPAELRKTVLPFSRLLSLSQFVEALVLHERLQFELGSTPDWEKYRAALETSTLYRLSGELRLPLRPYEQQVDARQEDILAAATWAAEQAVVVPVEPIEHAIRFRSGTYDGIGNILDVQNPMLARYLNVIRESGDGRLNEKVADAIAHLTDNHVGCMGLHVLMRVKLLEDHLGQTNAANYFPHFSRQPLIVCVNDPLFRLKSWTIDLIRRRREEILAGNEPGRGTDNLALALSPIFLACMAEARAPEEIVEKACCLRETPAAREYREECLNIYRATFVEDSGAIGKFKSKIREKIEGLRSVLPNFGAREEFVTEWSVSGKIAELLGWKAMLRRTTSRANIGDRTCVFLSDVLSQTIGIMSAQEKIATLFGVDVRYDAGVISCTSPRH